MTEERLHVEQSLREQAIQRLKKRRDFHGHVLIYVLINILLIVIWATASPDSFFWPVFAIVGWGIGVVMHGWDVYFARDFDEERIQREIAHLQGRR